MPNPSDKYRNSRRVYIRHHTIGYNNPIVWASCTLVSICILLFLNGLFETSYISNSQKTNVANALFSICSQRLFSASPHLTQAVGAIYYATVPIS